MGTDKISIKLLKAEKKKLKDELNGLTGKNTELQARLDENQIEIVNLQAEITQIGVDIDTLKDDA